MQVDLTLPLLVGEEIDCDVEVYVHVYRKMKSPLCLLSVVTMMLVPPDAHGDTVSISQPTFTALADFAPAGFGQSFTASGTYSITAIDLYVSASSGGTDATLRIYDYNSSLSLLGTVILGAGTFVEANLSTTPAWIRINLAAPVPVTSGDEYAFMVVAKDPGGSTGWNNYGFNASNVYSGGSRLGGNGSQGTSDLAFAVVTVPEPSSALLLMIGFLALSGRTRTESLRARVGEI